MELVDQARNVEERQDSENLAECGGGNLADLEALRDHIGVCDHDGFW